MAWDAPGAYQYSYPADVDLSNAALNQFMAVAIGPATQVAGNGQGNAAVLAYAAGQNFCAILQNTARLGEACTLMFQGFSRCQCATAWSAGQPLKVVAGGQLAPASGSDTVFAMAAESAVPGDTSTCYLK